MGMDTISIVLSVEKAFGIEITDEEVERAHTVGDLFRLVLDKADPPPVSHENRRCWQCNYRLRGLTSGRCPECGERFIRCDHATAIRTWRLLIDILARETGVGRDAIKPNTRFFPDLNT